MRIKNPREAIGILEDWRKSESVSKIDGVAIAKSGLAPSGSTSQAVQVHFRGCVQDRLLKVVIKAGGSALLVLWISGKERAAPASNDQWVLRTLILIAPTSRNNNDDRIGCDV